MYADKRWLSLIITLCLVSMNQSQEEDETQGVSKSDSNSENLTPTAGNNQMSQSESDKSDEDAAPESDSHSGYPTPTTVNPVERKMLSPGSGWDLIAQKSTKEIEFEHFFFHYCDRTLSVICIVNDNIKSSFDSTIENLKTTYPKNICIFTINVSKNEYRRFKMKGEFNEAIILLHRFGIWKNQFTYSSEDELKNIIKDHKAMPEEEFKKTNEAVPPTITHQVPSGDIVTSLNNAEEYKKIMSKLEPLETVVFFYVRDTVEYDWIFDEVAKDLTKISFFRVDTKLFVPEEFPELILQPMVTVYKFGSILEQFPSVDKDLLKQEIQKYDDFKGCAAYEDNKPMTEIQFQELMSECDRNKQLFVIYIVNNNTKFDSDFSSLKQLNPYVLFVKIDISTFKSELFNIKGSFYEVIIVCHRFKVWKNQFTTYPGKEELDKKIKAYNAMTEEEFQKTDEAVLPAITLQGTSSDIVKTLKDDTEFEVALRFDDNTKMAVVIIVNHTQEYDSIFTKLANAFKDIAFFRIDSSEFSLQHHIMKKPIVQPLVTINKFGRDIDHYFSLDVAFLETEFKKYISFKGCVDYTKEIRTENQLNDLLEECDDNRQLSVIYIVKNNNTLDSIFSDLKISYPYTMFVKIEKSTFDSNNKKFDIDGSKGESKILLHRFGDWRNEFIYSDEEELKKIISVHDKLKGCGNYDKKQIKTEDRLKELLAECKISKQLSVIYIVNNNNTFDQTFFFLEYAHPYIMFVKIDLSIFQSNDEMINDLFKIEESNEGPKIIFHRFGHWNNGNIYCRNAHELERILTYKNKQTEEQFTKADKDLTFVIEDDSESDDDDDKQEANGHNSKSINDEKKADADVPKTEGGNTNGENSRYSEDEDA